MVSPFMSFATGALQAVNQNIDRYRANKAKEEERADVAAQRMKELEFERETRLKVAGVNKESAVKAAEARYGAAQAGKVTKIGGFSFDKITDTKDRVNAHLAAIAANPAEATRLLNSKDPEEARAFKRHLMRMYQDGVTAFSRTKLPGDAKKPPPIIFTGYFSNVLSGKELAPIRSFFQELDDGNYGQASSYGPDTGAVIKKAGETILLPDNPAVTSAINAASKAHFTGIGRNRPDQIKWLAENIGEEYKKELKAYEGANKFYSAADSALVKMLGMKQQPSAKLIEDANTFLYNPEHGFVDQEGNITNDFIKLVEVYGGQNEEMSPVTPGAVRTERAEFRTWESYSASTAGKKAGDIANVKIENVGLTAKALTNIDLLIVATAKAGTGSRTTNRLLQLIEGVPGVVEESVKIIDRAIMSFGDGRFDDSGLKLLRDTKRQYDKIVEGKDPKNLTESQRAAIEAAKVTMLETALAYQLTSILQGGTGGRTISDQDVKNTLEMFTGTYTTKAMKQAKLQAIRKMIVAHQNEARLYSLLQRPNVNSGLYYSILKAAPLINNYSSENYVQKIRKEAGTKPPSEEPEKNLGSIRATDNIRTLADNYKKLSGDNYAGEDRVLQILRDERIFGKKLKPISLQASGSDKKQMYLVPFNGAVNWRNVVDPLIKQDGLSEEEVSNRVDVQNLKLRLERDFKHGINIQTNEIIEIDYLPDGTIGTKDKTPGPGASLNINTGAAKLFGGSALA